jgi:hypothetical protein
MSAVVSMLEGQTIVDEVIIDPSIYGNELRLKAIRDQFDHMQPGPTSLIHSSEATWIGSSSISAQDLYQVNLDSQ